MLEAAQYFQAREDTIDKSVLLYHRAGNLAKAIELVFNYRRFGALENLVEELDKDTDVNVLTRCADFFLENNRHAKAAYLFLLSKEVHTYMYNSIIARVYALKNLILRAFLPYSSTS